jgi:hypothetical protein
LGNKLRPWRLLASFVAFTCTALALLGSPVVCGAETAKGAKPSRAEVIKRKAAKPSAKSKAAAPAKIRPAKAPATKEAKKSLRPARLAPVRPQAPASAQIAGPTALPAIATPVQQAHSLSLLWCALAAPFILAAAELLWRRRRHAGAQWQPVEFIEPVLNLDVSDLARFPYPAAPANFPPRKAQERWRFTRESDADAWRVAAVEPAF